MTTQNSSPEIQPTPKPQGEAVGLVSDALLGEFEYLRIEVTRTQSTDLYLKVPKGWRPKGRNHRVLGVAAAETTDRSDWDDYQWEQTVEMQSCAVCSEKEARQYMTYEVKPEPSSPNVSMSHARTEPPSRGE